MTQDFRPFKKVMTKVQDATIDSAYEIYMALYHQLVAKEEDNKPDPFTQVKPDFFDLIIVDECHRGSAKDDSAWRKVLEYFSSATQIGMTATPKAETGANNLDYFGTPVYTYSLLQGIQDGFLAPYRVTNSFISIDLQGFTPEEDERDLLGREIEQRLYERKDIGRNIAFIKRREIVAHRITKMLQQIGRMTKTIVFCSDTEEAEAMRELLVTLNADLCRKNPNYVMRITGDDAAGKKQLDNFIDVDALYPTVVTTSELLATGVDCKTCGLIVIDKEIGSMTEFKQIIGRKKEIGLLTEYYHSGKAEFVAVYGRRRIGKTYLVRNLFRDKFAFDMSGSIEAPAEAQLSNFGFALREYGDSKQPIPTNWTEAFEALKQLLKAKMKGERLVVFIDELPCLDTPKSGFQQAFEHFWNGWAAYQSEIMLIVCGSATSWMIANLIDSHGGLHNRITHEMYLAPFTLRETELMLQAYGL